MRMNVLLTVLFLITQVKHISSMEIAFETPVFISRDTYYRLHQHGWTYFLNKSDLWQTLSKEEYVSLKKIIDIVDSSIINFNKTNPGFFDDPKCQPFNAESTLLYTILYSHPETRKFLFKQDPKRFSTLLDKDEKY